MNPAVASGPTRGRVPVRARSGTGERVDLGTQPRGRLLAVCGLCRGAGATSLAYLVARVVSEADARPVLLCDTGGSRASLARYAGVASAHSVAAVTLAVALGERLERGLFAEASPGLRLIARGPDSEDAYEKDGITRLLHDAREAHALTVIDCGTLQCPIDRAVLGRATHVAWVFPATDGGLQRAAQALGVLPRDPLRSELVVARHDGTCEPPPTPELTALAAERAAPLVLMPSLDLAECSPAEAIDEAGVTLSAISGAVHR